LLSSTTVCHASAAPARRRGGAEAAAVIFTSRQGIVAASAARALVREQTVPRIAQLSKFHFADVLGSRPASVRSDNGYRLPKPRVPVAAADPPRTRRAVLDEVSPHRRAAASCRDARAVRPIRLLARHGTHRSFSVSARLPRRCRAAHRHPADLRSLGPWAATTRSSQWSRLSASEIAPTRTRLTAQVASRLNQLRDSSSRPRYR